MSWLPLESNPDVLTSYLHKLGVPKSFVCTDVLGLDDDLLSFVPQPCHALFLLFPHDKTEWDDSKVLHDDSVFFMKQHPTIGEACGTIAVMNALPNIPDKVPLDASSTFAQFFERVKDKNPEQRCDSLIADEDIAAAHEESVQEGQTEAPEELGTSEHHFISFVENKGRVLEFDGLKPGPICHGTCSNSVELLHTVAHVVQDMADKTGQLDFSLIALVNNPEPDEADDSNEGEESEESEEPHKSDKSDENAN